MKVILFANSAWYLYNYRLSLAKYLRDSGYDIVLVSPADKYGERLIEEGFSWRPVSGSRRVLSLFNEIGMMYSLVMIYIKERPDIVHHFTLKCVIYGSLVASFIGTGAVINAAAGLGYIFSSSSRKARLLRNVVTEVMRRLFMKKGSVLILQNPDDVDSVVKSGIIDLEHVRLIRGSGVDPDRFSDIRIKDELTEHKEYTVLLASRMLWSKGIAEYADAARILKKEGISVRFRLAGAPDPGNPESLTAEDIKKIDDEGIVEVVGHIDDISLELKKTDIFVLPTYYGEGVPRSLLEAAACAIPLITTDMPGCREIVIHNETGLLVPPKDSSALAAAIRRYCQNAVLARKLGQAAYEKMKNEFSETIVLRDTIAVYEDLLDL